MHSEIFFLKIVWAAPKFGKTQAFARLKNEFRCMHLAHISRMVGRKWVKSSAVCRDWFQKIVGAVGMKLKDCHETFRKIVTLITKQTQPFHISLQKKTKTAGELWFTLKSRLDWTLVYIEWDWICICWTYNTILDNNSLPLHKRL